jgi:hypothetical protein
MDAAKTYSVLAGEWYWEYSHDTLHQVNDAEAIRVHLLRVIYGTFANAKKNSANSLRYLDWVGYISGKRESRRLIGDYIYTLSDIANGTKFEDAVAEEGRDVDVHYQRAETGGIRISVCEGVLQIEAIPTSNLSNGCCMDYGPYKRTMATD